MAERIQRRRTKGWRLPAGAVYVGRGSRWGNPWPLSIYLRDYPDLTDAERRFMAVDDYRLLVSGRWDKLGLPAHPTETEIREALGGHDLACYCPLDQPCHADVLLELARG